MAITPAGSPAWTRAATHEDYGGDLNKQNYLSKGVIDALTDVGAEEICRIAADLEAVTRTSPFCVMNITCNDATSAAPTVNSALLMTGARSTSYEGDAPPTGFPECSRVSDGVVDVTFAASYSDDYGAAGAFAPAHVMGGAGSFVPVTCTATTSGAVVRVYCWDGSGFPLVAMPDAVFSVSVW